ncbi:MAG TPA: FGGY family carbohydrate kinase [Nitrospiria bacterium]|nr:FGGY family carbohydrate kinase [Nitrospiria bacterium]
MRKTYRPTPLLLAIDQGSSSSRAILFELNGKVVAAASEPLSTFTPKPDRVEHDPEEILAGQMAALRRVIRRAPRNRAIACMGIANQRSTLVLWRRRDGAPLGPAISWQDRRTSSICRTMQKNAPVIGEKTGLRLSPHYAASKLTWLLSTNRSIRRRLENGELLCGTVNSFLIWHLTGGNSYLTDHTNAARMLLMNLDTLEWDPELIGLFGLSESFLPEPRPTFSDFGTAQIEGRTVPIRCSIGDQQAALLGQGCCRPGEAAINYGTGAFFLLHTGGKIRRRPGLLTSIASSDANGADYLLEGTVNAVGSLLDWMRNLVGLPKGVLPDAACQSSARKKGSRRGPGPILVPALRGLGAPHWLDRVPSFLTGLGEGTRREDLFRCAVESVAYLIRDIHEAMGSRCPSPKVIRVGGGISKIDYLLQFQANLLQIPLQRSDDEESTARGAAIGAAVGAGLVPISSVRPPERETIFRPILSRSKSTDLYGEWKRTLRMAKRFRR